MAKTSTKASTPAQIRKDLSDVAQLITGPRLATALSSIASDAKRFAKAKANPKAFLANNQIMLEVPGSDTWRLTRAGTKITICYHGSRKFTGIVIDEKTHERFPVEGVLETKVCTTFIKPKS
jgi:hypothetical protein